MLWLLSGLQGFTSKLTDVMPVLIWVQTVCEGYQQTTKAAVSKERTNMFPTIIERREVSTHIQNNLEKLENLQD